MLETSESIREIKNPLVTSKLIKKLYFNSQKKELEKKVTSSWTYAAHTDDFGINIHSLLVPKSLPQNLGNDLTFFLQNIKVIGQKEGFAVHEATRFYYPRDSRIRIAAGKILRSTDSEEKILFDSLRKLNNREKYYHGQSAMTATKHPDFEKIQGGGIQQNLYQLTAEGYSEDSKTEYHDLISHSQCTTTPAHAIIKSTRSYWEGGNIFSLTNLEGKIKVLIGEHSLTLTHLTLKANKYFFKPNPYQAVEAFLKETSDPFAELKDKINQLYLNQEIPTVIQNLVSYLPDEQVVRVALEMKSMNLISYLNLDSSNMPKLQATTRNYLGQREFVKQVLWPHELEVNAEDIILLPQADYHLDTFLKPGPHGSVFLQDFDQTLALLESIKIKASELDLTAEDLSILENYCLETKLLAHDLKAIYGKIHLICQEAQIKVIPIAGTFFGCDSKKNSLNLNFLNAISGYSTLNQQFYYIALGAKVGDKLGGVLMEAFRETLKQFVSPIQIYYVGYDPQNPTNYQEAMNILNICKAGAHCLSVELETSSTVL